MPKIDVHCSEKFADIDYAGDDQVYHKMDIYLPRMQKDVYPVVVHIYGSSWYSNNSKGMADLGTIVNALLDAGYAVVTPNHRSSADAKFPAQIHDIKGQMRYPLTFKEILPYILGVLLLAALAYLVWRFVVRRRKDEVQAHKDPPYIVALRRLDGFRGEKFWVPEKQKAYYSGITDTLREYIADTFGIDAREMTTAEIFDALKGHERLTDELYGSTKDLFELADFVKFAKHVASDEENAAALPLSVRFVTSTYQSTLEDESQQGRDDNEKEAE